MIISSAVWISVGRCGETDWPTARETGDSNMSAAADVASIASETRIRPEDRLVFIPHPDALCFALVRLLLTVAMDLRGVVVPVVSGQG